MPTGALFLSSTWGSTAHSPLQKALQLHSFIYLLYHQVTKFWFLQPGVGGVSCWASTAAGRPCQPPPPAEPAGGEAAAAEAEVAPLGRGAITTHPTPPVLPGKSPQPGVCKRLQAFYSKTGQRWSGSAQVCSCASCGMCRIGAFF